MVDKRYTLVVVETASIQSYIFNSNRLRENIGASYLVAQATGAWAYDCVQQTLPDNNNVVMHNGTLTIDRTGHIENNETYAEVLYSGGGNFVVLFTSDSDAKTFVRLLSRQALENAPGLSLTFVTGPMVWDDHALSCVVSELLGELSAERSEQPHRRGIGGLGVTVMCSSSSLPSVHLQRDLDGNLQSYSAEIHSKRMAGTKANGYLTNLLELNRMRYQDLDVTAEDFMLDTEFDHLGRSFGEDSHMAVVHADGNGLGLLIKGLQKDYPNAGNVERGNREYITYMRELSENIKEANRYAQQQMMQQLARSIRKEGTERVIYPFPYGETSDRNASTKITLEKENSKWILPIRLLVSGGDDVTFVCDGRIAFDLTVTFLKAFEEASTDPQILGPAMKKIEPDKLTACAGIAVVNVHYPFARAYALADDLAGKAKTLVNREAYAKERNFIKYSAFDWHFTTGGIYDDIDGIREREYDLYEGDPKRLLLRPIFLEKSAHRFRTWEHVQETTEIFQQEWANNRSKTRGLMNAVRQGEVEAQVYNLRYLDGDLPLPDVAGFQQTFGWQDNDATDQAIEGATLSYCGYFDALELVDLYLPLHRKQDGA